MRKPTPVTTSSMSAVSASTYAVTLESNSPATIHVKSVVVTGPFDHARAATEHETRKTPATAGTAIQCARRPVRRPRKMLARAPARGKAGISQTVDTASIYRRAARGVKQGRAASDCPPTCEGARDERDDALGTLGTSTTTCYDRRRASAFPYQGLGGSRTAAPARGDRLRVDTEPITASR